MLYEARGRTLASLSHHIGVFACFPTGEAKDSHVQSGQTHKKKGEEKGGGES